MATDLHVILGTGPVSCWTATHLRQRGLRVRAVNRSGRRPDLMPAEVEIVAADVADQRQAIDACQGADVVYQALNPPYHQWAERFPALQASAMTAAETAGARYVSIDNLYGYGRVIGPISERTPMNPHTRKGRLRAAMTLEVLDAHASGRLRATILQSADYYGPGVTMSQFGERTFPPLLEGKPADVAGSANLRHAYAYIEDVGRAAAALGTCDDALGRVWIAPHAPAVTQREMVNEMARELGTTPRIRVISPLMMRLAGLFVPAAKESVEMLYQFTEPFEVDASAIERELGLAPTPLAEGLRRTLDWYRTRHIGVRLRGQTPESDPGV